MILGRFNAGGRPILRARLRVPRFDIDDEVNFLVDTGAINTCLHPRDAARIGFPFDELRDPFTMAGVGGSQSYYREPALVIVNDSDGERTFNITLSVTGPQLPTPSNPRPVVNLLPSLLGRDVLNRLRVDYDYPAGRLRFFP